MKWLKSNCFQIIFYILTALTIIFISANVLVIVLEGSQSLLRCISLPETRFAFFLSIKSACFSTVFCFLLAVPTAYVLSRGKLPFGNLAETVLELTMSLPYIVLGLSMLIIFSSPFGKWLKEIGFPVVFSTNGIILAQLIVNLPFAIKLSTTAFHSIDNKLERVAGLLGASEQKIFFTVILPLCKNSLISALILVWSRALGEFGATLMLVGITRMKTETLPGSIYLNVSTNDLGGALASAFILLIMSAISLGIANLFTYKNKRLGRYE